MVSGSTINRLSGISSLIAYACVTRINKADMQISARMNLAVSLYSLLRAGYHNDPAVSGELHNIGGDLKSLREQYEIEIDADNYGIEKRNEYNLILDGIEYRLHEIIVKTKVIDGAGLREMWVPDE